MVVGASKEDSGTELSFPAESNINSTSTTATTTDDEEEDDDEFEEDPDPQDLEYVSQIKRVRLVCSKFPKPMFVYFLKIRPRSDCAGFGAPEEKQRHAV